MATIPVFYKKLRNLCEERGLTVNELARLLGLSTGSPTAWKNGTLPRAATLSKIADYFGVSVHYLMDEQEKENSPSEPMLTEGEEMLLNLFRQVPADQQELVLQMIRVALGKM